MPFCDSRRSNNLCSLANSKTKSTTLNNFSLLFQSHMTKSFRLSRGPTGINRTLHTSNKDMITSHDYRCSIVFREAIISCSHLPHTYTCVIVSPTACSNRAFRCTTGPQTRVGRWLEDGRCFPTFCALKHQLLNFI